MGTELDVDFPPVQLRNVLAEICFLLFKGWCSSHGNLRPITAIVDPDQIDMMIAHGY